MRKGCDGGKKNGKKNGGEKMEEKKEENTDENSVHYVIASSRLPKRRPLECRLLVPTRLRSKVFSVEGVWISINE